MLNKNNKRELAYLAKITNLESIPNYDRVELATVNDGWKVIVRKGCFKVGDSCVYIEVDSVCPAAEPFLFLEPRKYKIKTLKMCGTVSQGLVMSPSDFGWTVEYNAEKGNLPYVTIDNKPYHFLTEILGIKHIDTLKESRKGKKNRNVDTHQNLRKRLSRSRFMRFLLQYKCFRTLIFKIADWRKKKKENKRAFPCQFEGVKPTDQERVENMPYVLKDKSFFIVTQKCDGSSATYILERKPFNKFEFYVCSRNIRQLDENQENLFEENYYWKAAKKYDIYNKMKDYLTTHDDLSFVCWQGEIVHPKIQGNPHHVKDLHLYMFHWIDSSTHGKMNILEAETLWLRYKMEVVPITAVNYVLPDSLEEFKVFADGNYASSVCEGQSDCMREGLVLYNMDNPNFSFKNVSIKYLLSK